MRRSLLILAAIAIAVCAIVIFWSTERAPSAKVGSSSGSRTAPAQDASTAPTPDHAPLGPVEKQWTEPVKRAGVNAANLYADAFAALNRLTDGERKMLKNPQEEVDADAAAALFEKIKPILELLRQAAAADYCDWGTGELTVETQLPHLGLAQGLAVLARWAAAYRFPTEPGEAIADLAATTQLGHHVCDTLIGALVSGSIEAIAMSGLEGRMGALDAATAELTQEWIAGSKLDEDLARAMYGEKTIAGGWLKKLEAMNPLERASELKSMLGDGADGSMSAEVQRIVQSLLLTPERIASEVGYLQEVESKAAEMMQRRDAEFKAWWKSVSADVQQNHPLAKLALPSLDSVQQMVQGRRVQRALLLAGLEVMQHGQGRVAHHRDPSTGGAILYVQTATGFELRSSYQAKGKPVTMIFQR